MNEAISDPALQTVELHHVSKHIIRGHVVLHFYSTAAAESVTSVSVQLLLRECVKPLPWSLAQKVTLWLS